MATENASVIYVRLTDEGGTARPTQAINLGNGLFKVLPIDNYAQSEETWEFPPGSIVKCREEEGINGKYMLAVKAS